MTMVEGLLALRAVGDPLSQNTEAEIAGVQHELWERLTADEQQLLDAGGLVEAAKERWGVGVRDA